MKSKSVKIAFALIHGDLASKWLDDPAFDDPKVTKLAAAIDEHVAQRIKHEQSRIAEFCEEYAREARREGDEQRDDGSESQAAMFYAAARTAETIKEAVLDVPIPGDPITAKRDAERATGERPACSRCGRSDTTLWEGVCNAGCMDG